MRAVLLAVIIGAVAVVLHRVELIVFATPFAVWSGLGWWRLRNARGTTGERLPTDRLRVGQITAHRVSTPDDETIVAVHLPRPPRCEIDPGHGNVVGVSSAEVRIRPMRWGRHTLRASVVNVSDPWATWTGTWKPQDASLTVAPSLDTPGGSDVIPHPSGLAGPHLSRTRGDGIELAEIRSYMVGDRLNRINWRVSSRMGSLHTNASIADRDTEVLIVVDTLDDLAADQSAGLASETAPSSSIDIAVSAAATIADHYLGLGDRVGLHDLGQVIGSVRAGAGVRQRGLIMETLAGGRVDRAGRDDQLRPLGRIRPGSLVLCCTPLLSPEVTDEILRLLHRGATVLVIDTMPTQLGHLDAMAWTSGGVDSDKPNRREWQGRLHDRLRRRRFWSEAWALRRIGRKGVVEGLTRLGVPVVPWHGIASLGHMVAALAARRTSPHRARG